MTVIKFQLRFTRVIDPETGEFITDEFRILEDVEFPAIDTVGAVGEDGFYVNATHEYDASLKYSTAINGSNNYAIPNYLGDVFLSEVLVTYGSETYNIEFQQNKTSFELSDEPKLFTQTDLILEQDDVVQHSVDILDLSFSNSQEYFVSIDETAQLALTLTGPDFALVDFQPSDNLLTFNLSPNNKDVGNHSALVELSDPDGNVSSKVLNLSVTNTNDSQYWKLFQITL